MPDKHPNTERIGGPGTHPSETKGAKYSGKSGGGGEPDSHHTHDPAGKAGKA